MTLATATPDGRPSARMVLLKQVDDDGFVFFTNYQQRKGESTRMQIRTRLWFFTGHQLERQVRVEGSVVRTSAEESRDYFQTRPRESQIGAWASAQSEVISGARSSRATSAGVGELCIVIERSIVLSTGVAIV